ncbi:MAG: D-2-hydroxyacid dehydrogenase [Chitinophagaceae bacterium]
MKIVVADGYALNPGDLNWDAISSLGDLKVYDRCTTAEVLDRCKDADIILTNKTTLSADTLKALPRLKFISVLATGFNIVDTAAAKKVGVTVSNVPGYGTASVAQHVFALLLELTNHVGINARAVANGKWVDSEDFCFTEAPLMELARKTMGIIGFGNIGQQVGRIAIAFGMKVIYAGPRDKKVDFGEYRSQEELFRYSDVISLHAPLTADNREFVNAALLSTMKKSAILINTARGQLIHEQHLADALNQGIIKAAALDVLSKEPPDARNPLLKAKNCLLSPHVAWITYEARQRIMAVTAENIKGFLKGDAVNLVG